MSDFDTQVQCEEFYTDEMGAFFSEFGNGEFVPSQSDFDEMVREFAKMEQSYPVCA